MSTLCAWTQTQWKIGGINISTLYIDYPHGFTFQYNKIHITYYAINMW